MLKRKTTFVLGAGASHELGMPLGDGLQAAIRKLLNEESNYLASNATRVASRVPIFAALRNGGLDNVQASRAIQHVADGITTALSVDTYLHNNGHDAALVQCGKLGIVQAIAEAEAVCPLVDENAASRFCTQREIVNHNGLPSSVLAIRNSYLSVIWDELCASHTRESIGLIFKNIAFVNFNYDRSLEEGFKFLLMRGFGLPVEDALALIDTIEIVRPYGCPHGSTQYSRAVPRFGDIAPQELGNVGGNIRTFTETIDSVRAEAVRRMVDTSEVLVFLGFGFHDQNVELLKPPTRRGRDVYFSYLRGSASNATYYFHQLKKLFALNLEGPKAARLPAEVQYHDGTCIGTLNHFRRSLFHGDP